jgi:hypothetical protein
VCITYLNEQNDLLNSILNPLTDGIYVFGERLKMFLVIVIRNLNNGVKIVIKKSIILWRKSIKNLIASLPKNYINNKRKLLI